MLQVKNIVKALLAVFLMLLAVLIFVLYYIFAKGVENSYKNADYIVVFGAAVNPNKKPSDALEDRLQEALDLYNKSVANKIILSGAPSVFSAHEVDVMREYLIQNGVASSSLILDYSGYNTCYTVRNLSDNFKNKSLLLLSNDFHLARIDFFADYFNLNYTLHGVKSEGYIKRPFFILREAVALIYFWLFFDGTCENGLAELNIKIDNWFSKLFYSF